MHYKGGVHSTAKTDAIFKLYNNGLEAIVHDKELQEVFMVENSIALENVMNDTQEFLKFETRFEEQSTKSEYAAALSACVNVPGFFSSKVPVPEGYPEDPKLPDNVQKFQTIAETLKVATDTTRSKRLLARTYNKIVKEFVSNPEKPKSKPKGKAKTNPKPKANPKSKSKQT